MSQIIMRLQYTLTEDPGLWTLLRETPDPNRLSFLPYTFPDIVAPGILIPGRPDEGTWVALLFNLALYIAEATRGFCSLSVFIGGKGSFLGISNVSPVDGWVSSAVAARPSLFDPGTTTIIWLRIAWSAALSTCPSSRLRKISFSFRLMLYASCNKTSVSSSVKSTFSSIDVISSGLAKLKLYRWLGGGPLLLADSCAANSSSVFSVAFEFTEHSVPSRTIPDSGDRLLKSPGGVSLILNLLKRVHYCCQTSKHSHEYLNR